mmetsp:Transcript_49136/g.129657  ORF Transcript_49136/g.129657 Transcript_49136/m.129657 type:complete len:89 (+) Transcript_49136:84-350(+)
MTKERTTQAHWDSESGNMLGSIEDRRNTAITKAALKAEFMNKAFSKGCLDVVACRAICIVKSFSAQKSNVSKKRKHKSDYHQCSSWTT